MAAKTDAQEEFDNILAKASKVTLSSHPSDSNDYKHDAEHSDRDEDEQYTQARIDENMRMPTFDRSSGGGGGGVLHLPHRDFDSGRTTGVKGVIADARSYEEARRNGARKNRIGGRSGSSSRKDQWAESATFLKDDGEGSASEDEDFIERWRAQRREELQRNGNDIRNRRTSPSVRSYGRFDEVDAMGYLDAIEKVGRDTVVVVFVYDPDVSRPDLHCSHHHSNPSLAVSRLPSHLRCSIASRPALQKHPFCPRPLRSHRVRQRWSAGHPGVQEPGRPLRKPHLHH